MAEELLLLEPHPPLEADRLLDLSERLLALLRLLALVRLLALLLFWLRLRLLALLLWLLDSFISSANSLSVS